VDSDVRFLTFADPLGWRIYRTTASFLLAKVMKELFPDARFSIEHSLGTGFYCFFEQERPEGITTSNWPRWTAPARAGGAGPAASNAAR
jgi:threonyl-tRNA synthetase